MPGKPSPIEHRVRRATKRIEYSIGSLEEYLAEHGGNFSARARLRGSSEYVRIVVRVRRFDKPLSWAMSVLLNDQRIDGIDWEPVVHDHRGKIHNCRGWHRHIWMPATTDTLKECLPTFDPDTVREFVVGGFRMLKVQLKKESRDAGNTMLWDY
jgi:hypothetical protein